MRVPVGLDADNEDRRDRPVDHVDHGRVDRVPAGRRLKIRRAAQRQRAWRRAEIFRHDERARDAERFFFRDRRIRHRERDVFLDRAHAAERKLDDDGEERIPFAARAAQEVRELVPSLAEEFEMEGFVRLERRVDEIAERAAGFKHGAVPRVLREQRPLRFTTRLESDARAPRVGIEPHFHPRMVMDSVRGVRL